MAEKPVRDLCCVSLFLRILIDWPIEQSWCHEEISHKKAQKAFVPFRGLKP
jgi:hypothetical protein